MWLENVKLRAGATLTDPPRGLTVRATPPAGDETVILAVTRLPLRGFVGPGTTTTPFTTQLTHDGFRRALASKTDALPRSSWAFAEAKIRIQD